MAVYRACSQRGVLFGVGGKRREQITSLNSGEKKSTGQYVSEFLSLERCDNHGVSTTVSSRCGPRP